MGRNEDLPEHKPFSFSAAMRSKLIEHQKADYEVLQLQQKFNLEIKARERGYASQAALSREQKRKPAPVSGEYKLEEDGCLVRLVEMSSGDHIWTPYIPSIGGPTEEIQWRPWLFQVTHAGAFGGHPSFDQTFEKMRRIANWPGMRRDIKTWCDECWTCIQYRKRPQKLQAGTIVAKSALPWAHIFLDFEGPITPPDIAGYTRVLAVVDALTNAAILIPVMNLEPSEVRRAISTAVCRMGTIPRYWSHDQGPEFDNHVNRELAAMYGTTVRVGSAWRPWEQSPVEREHLEEQRILGALLGEVFRCHPGEWATLLPLVEFIRMNTPGKNGLTPRDLLCSWSIASPLE